jgi:hypothetical protein
MIRSLISASAYCRTYPASFHKYWLVAKELGVLTVGQISLDGTKIKANASKASRLELHGI